MTNEQREAIDRFKHLLNLKYTPFNGGRNVLIDKEAIDTALSLIKEQQAEMEDLKNKSVLIKRYFKKCDLIKQKDKQIDLMADFMHKTRTGRRAFSCAFRQNDECDENGCRHCIKQYFVDKAKKETKET